MNESQHQLAWRVGGPQGSGVDSAAGIFSRACALGGLNVFGRREYYSNIMGRHSYFDVRVGHKPVHIHRDRVQLLTTFETESLARHDLTPGERDHEERGQPGPERRGQGEKMFDFRQKSTRCACCQECVCFKRFRRPTAWRGGNLHRYI